MNQIQKKLLTWYDKNKRDLPWRKTNDPYQIWISEVMLQQTRVDTVIPYYKRFLEKFSTVEKLAAADPQTVLKSWEGLGYYSRARNLMAAAKDVVENYGSKLPNTAEKLRTLKGFGPYTSAAVASIAFGEPVACVDGNVKRVTSRIFATHENLDQHAQELIAHEDPSSFNQAMMELGALICLPKNPKCLICPIQKECKAYQLNQIADFPAAKLKTKIKNIYAAAVIVSNKNKFLITKRSDSGRYANFFEFPTIESSQQLTVPEIKKNLKETFGVTVQNLKTNHAFEHQLTHRTYHVQAFAAETAKISPHGMWLTKEQIEKIPFSKLQQRVLNFKI